MTDDLDTLLAQYKPEEIKKKTFQELLEAAEGFTPDYDPPVLTAWCKDVALSRVDLAAESRLLREMKKRSKVPTSELKVMLQKQKGKHTSSEEDFGRLLCKATLARHFNQGEYLARLSGDFYVFTGKLWERRTDDQITWYVNNTLLDTPNPDGISHSGALSQAMSLIRAVSSRPDDVFNLLKDPLPIINLANGELWINTNGTFDLRQHSHTSYQMACLDVVYDPYATCPMYDKALLDIFANSRAPEEMARHWNEFAGYAIQPLRDIPSWWLLKGQGKNGKTRLIETLIKLMGSTAVAVIAIEQLKPDNRFALSRLIGKLMLLDEDLNKNAHLPDGLLKSLSETKLMQAEYKGRDAFNFICRALPVMLSNHFPRTSDQSYGMMRRANIIPFARQFKGPEADDTLFPRIWTTELPGVLNRALQGLQRIRARGGFHAPADCLRAVEVWSNQVNPVRAFITDCLEPAPECRLRWTDVYNRFKEWAKDENLRFIPGRNSVKQEFVTIGVEFKWSVEGHHMILGYGLRTSDESPGIDENT